MEQNTTPSQPKNYTPLMIVGLVAIVALVGLVLVRSSAAPTSSDTSVVQETIEEQPTNTGEEIAVESTVQGLSDTTEEELQSESQVQTIAVEGGSFYYNPNTITVKKGQRVKIELTSKDMMHDFVIDELNVRIPVTNAGETSTIEFTADQEGTYEYYCSVGQHRANGQKGTLIVEG